jgi:2-succinyl-5-enolpyruvyl-6-hydroxy-3-cyclohexene-1-carboxylate synthase
MTTPRSSSPATDFAAALLDSFAARGVRDVVVSPGSRSQAIALAAADRHRSGDLRLHVRIDERVSGFLALGLAVETTSPVLVVTTSGTAVANLHPAVLEAHHSGVPLIVVSADRPERLRGIGANQTTVQPGIFGAAVRAMIDVPAPSAVEAPDAAALAARVVEAAATGPVHLNLAFDVPLSGDVPPVSLIELVETAPTVYAGEISTSSISGGGAISTSSISETIHVAPATIVVAGAGAGEIAESTARALGAPLLAEVSSGAHFGPNLVVAYRDLLNRANFGDRVERVVIFGHPTLSREVPALAQRDGVETIVVRSASLDDYNPGHRVSRFVDHLEVDGEPDTSPAGRAWLGRWVMTSRAELEQHDAPPVDLAISNEPVDQAAFSRAVLAGLRAPVTRRALVEAVWRMTWPHDRLVVAASRLIRELDSVAPGKKIRVHANRGLAGIDGTIATATGIAIASQSLEGASAGGITRVLIGDLALLHDVGALLVGLGENRPRLQLVVGNDRGGTIFDGLEVAQTAPAGDLDRVMLTPHEVDLEHLAAAYGWSYKRVTNRGQLDEMLTPSEGLTIVEVPLER